MRRRTRHRSLVALAVVTALAAGTAACGGGDDTGSVATDGPATTDPATTGPEPGDDVAMGVASRRPAAATEAEPAVTTLNGLGARLYGELSTANDDPNLVFSPASVAVALAMTRAGAAGDTAIELDVVLGISDPHEIHRAMNALTAQLGDRSGSFQRGDEEVEVILAVANSLWGQAGLRFEDPFLDTLSGEYGAGMRLVDYENDHEGARVAINSWVDDETRGRIDELIGSGVLSPDTRLVLVNAVYLKAPWAVEFPAARTRDADFTTVDGATVEVPMMALDGRVPYAAGEGWQAVELAYVGGELAMLLVLPDDLDAFGERLVDGALDEVADALDGREVHLRLPRFDTGTSTSLRPALESLGMPTAFSGRADFSPMTLAERLFVSDVIHAANITVDEDGTEAAAATAVVMTDDAETPDDEPVELTFDRPFVFALRDRATGAIAFLGHIGDPSVTRG